MNKFLLLLCLFVFVFQLKAKAQAPVHISIDMAEKTLTINGTAFHAGSTIEEYEKHLGKPNRIELKKGVDQYFIYDDLGLAFSLENEEDSDVVSEVFITYQHDGDRRVAEKPYRGTIRINKKELKPAVSPKEMEKLVKLDFVEVMNGYFITPQNTISLLLYYPEKAPYTKLKQFGIRFSKDN